MWSERFHKLLEKERGNEFLILPLANTCLPHRLCPFTSWADPISSGMPHCGRMMHAILPTSVCGCFMTPPINSIYCGNEASLSLVSAQARHVATRLLRRISAIHTTAGNLYQPLENSSSVRLPTSGMTCPGLYNGRIIGRQINQEWETDCCPISN
jgi:hypothetical protein